MNDKHAPPIAEKVKGRLCPWLTPLDRQKTNEFEGQISQESSTGPLIIKQQRNTVSSLMTTS